MKKKPSIHVFPTSNELIEAFCNDFEKHVTTLLSEREIVTVCVSGGSTPRNVFIHWANAYKEKIDWRKIHFYWGDERCVPPGHLDSNYGMVKTHFLDKVNIPKKNIHFIDGGNDPVSEAKRYTEEISTNIRLINGAPRFDLVMLGMGEDGHTASIFPDNIKIVDSDNICEVVRHPFSKKNRITLSGKVLNNAAQISFLITGKHKSEVVSIVIEDKSPCEKFPVNYIYPVDGKLDWYLDKAAASLIE